MKTITLPDIGAVESAEIIEIQIKPGDTIHINDTVMVLETDKAAIDIPTTDTGTVIEVKVHVGDTVRQGDTLFTLKENAPEEKKQHTANEPATSTDNTDSDTLCAPTTAENPGEETSTQAVNLVHAGPSVRKLARERNIDLTTVTGSGPHQRILKEDLEKLSEQATAVSSNDSHTHLNQYGTTQQIPLSKINYLTGQNTHRAWTQIPHVTQFGQADVTGLESFRTDINAKPKHRDLKLTLLPFLVKASISALQQYPNVNASLSEDHKTLTLKQYFHIGIAVDTAQGLLVPVIHHADQKGVFDIAHTISDLAKRAQNRKLKPEEMQGGCFTLSSLGHIAGTAFTPIINTPEVAILGISRAEIKPIYNGKKFKPRLMLPLSLSYDHRVIDGVLAAHFLNHIVGCLEDPRRLLL